MRLLLNVLVYGVIAAKVAEGPALHPGLLSSDPTGNWALFILFASLL